ncbi:hypothetical protein BH09BAC1_BH09BAC1_14700 [soil metagenome]
MYRMFCWGLLLVFFAGCADNEAPDMQEPEQELLEEAMPACNFQMQSLETLPMSKFKVVTGFRSCDSSGIYTREILLYAPGEPIDNRKECNVFATTDTATVWDLRLSPNHIEVVFYKSSPAEGTILIKHTTVYDSVTVVYGQDKLR